MSKERSIPIGTHAEHISKRNKHLVKAGLGVVGAVGAATAINPLAGAAVGVVALREAAEAFDHHEARRK